jgi:anti-sigma B factor antagonist
MVERFRTQLIHRHNAIVLMVVGEIDAATAPLLHEACLEAESMSDRLVLDAAGVTFMDSSALHVLVKAQQRLGTTNVVVRNPSDQVRRLLQLTGLEAHFLETIPTQPEDPTSTIEASGRPRTD